MISILRNNLTVNICLCVIIALIAQNVSAKEISVSDIYKLAQNNDIKNLKALEKYIDVENKDGDTAYCLALKNKEDNVVNNLTKSGTNTKHKNIA